MPNCVSHNRPAIKVCLHQFCNTRLNCDICASLHIQNHLVIENDKLLKLYNQGFYVNSLTQLDSSLSNQRLNIKASYQSIMGHYEQGKNKFSQFCSNLIQFEVITKLQKTVYRCKQLHQEESSFFKREKLKDIEQLVGNQHKLQKIVEQVLQEKSSYSKTIFGIKLMIDQAYLYRLEIFKLFQEIIQHMTKQLDLIMQYFKRSLDNNMQSQMLSIFLSKQRLTPHLLKKFKDDLYNETYHQMAIENERLKEQLEHRKNLDVQVQKELQRNFEQKTELRKQIEFINDQNNKNKESLFNLSKELKEYRQLIQFISKDQLDRANRLKNQAKGIQDKNIYDMASNIVSQLNIQEQLILPGFIKKLQSIDVLNLLKIHNKNLKTIDLSKFKDLDLQVYKFLITRCNSITCLKLNHTNFKVISQNFSKSSQFELIQTFEAEDCALNQKLSFLVNRMKKLQVLSLASNSLNYKFIEDIVSLRNLRHLNLSLNNLTAEAVYLICRKFQFLNFLNLSNNPIGTGAAIEITQYIKQLTQLYLSNCQLGLQAAFSIAKNLPLLKVLNISSNDIKEDGIMELIMTFSEAKMLLMRGNSLNPSERQRINRITSKLKTKVKYQY